MLPIPLEKFRGIPIGNHPGAFAARRKYDVHTGVDLYCKAGTPVFSMEAGVILKIANFTGPSMGYPWWLETQAIMVRQNSGAIVVYGELTPNKYWRAGFQVERGSVLGYVTPVLPDSKFRPDIPGHSVNMLHLEMWKDPTVDIVWEGWELDQERPRRIMDPTPYLQYQWELNHRGPICTLEMP